MYDFEKSLVTKNGNKRKSKCHSFAVSKSTHQKVILEIIGNNRKKKKDNYTSPASLAML